VIRAVEPVHGRSAEVIHASDELFAGIPSDSAPSAITHSSSMSLCRPNSKRSPGPPTAA